MLMIWALFLVLTTLWFLVPLARHMEVRNRRDFDEHYRLVKLRAIRRHYHQLDDLSLAEIEERFNIDEIYNRIGDSAGQASRQYYSPR